MAYQSVTRNATILNGASLSDAIVNNGAPVAGVYMPAAWTTADLTLQMSLDGANFNNVYDKDGTEVTIKAGASRYIQLNSADFVGCVAFKIRSGTSGTPVNQGADRTITAVMLVL